jgi:hypothetical protein
MKILITFCFCLSIFQAIGQRQTLLNPKAGLGITQLNEVPEGFSNKVDLGLQAGLDVRMGKRFFLQPGVFYKANTVALIDSSQFSLGDNAVVAQYMKFKLLGGTHLVNKEGFRLRLNAGPTFNYLLNVKSENENISLLEKDDFKSTQVNFEAGAGLDIWFFTFDLGYNMAFSKLFNIPNLNSRLFGAYMYVGFVIPL